jgi:hypothetical protein
MRHAHGEWPCAQRAQDFAGRDEKETSETGSTA